MTKVKFIYRTFPFHHSNHILASVSRVLAKYDDRPTDQQCDCIVRACVICTRMTDYD